MQHYVAHAILRGRIADSQIDEAIDTLIQGPQLKGMDAVRLVGRSVIRNLTFLELELLVQPDANTQNLAALVIHNLVAIANENTSGDNEAQWQRARDILAGLPELRLLPDEQRNTHRPKAYELLYAEGFHMGDAHQPEPLPPLQGNDPAQNAHRADLTETWQALLEHFQLTRPISVGKLS